jgi:hypothetical protein
MIMVRSPENGFLERYCFKWSRLFK